MSGSGGACVIGAHLIGHNANDYANKCLLNPHQEVLLDAIVLQILEIDTNHEIPTKTKRVRNRVRPILIL